jgi:membrane-associated phospholipid phosphatase
MPGSGGRPLLGDSRAWAALTLAGCVAVVVFLGLLFRGQTGPDGLDNAVDSPVVTFFGGHRDLLLWLALPGTLIPAVAVSAAVAAGALLTGRLSGAVLAVTAVPAATVLDDALLKHLFHRTYLGQLAFPSGHTTSATALAATLAVLLMVPPQGAGTRAARAAVTAAAFAAGAVTAVAVIGLRWHYFTDTVAGAAVGVGTVCALSLVLDLAWGQRPAARAGGAGQARPVRL